VAFDLVTPMGERGAIFGPMRSSMFVSDPDTLTKAGYTWGEAVPTDPGGFYRVLDDNGADELFTLSYVGCAD
jgi:hypothetical protein